MRKAHNNKRDAIEKDITTALVLAGCTVQALDDGDGCPDLLVGLRGVNTLLEVKDPDTGRLTPDQVDWHESWGGQVDVVSSIDEAFIAVGLMRR
jgi:hypothetical protein